MPLVTCRNCKKAFRLPPPDTGGMMRYERDKQPQPRSVRCPHCGTRNTVEIR